MRYDSFLGCLIKLESSQYLIFRVRIITGILFFVAVGSILASFVPYSSITFFPATGCCVLFPLGNDSSVTNVTNLKNVTNVANDNEDQNRTNEFHFARTIFPSLSLFVFIVYIIACGISVAKLYLDYKKRMIRQHERLRRGEILEMTVGEVDRMSFKSSVTSVIFTGLNITIRLPTVIVFIFTQIITDFSWWYQAYILNILIFLCYLLNSFINPILYFWRKVDFREYILAFFRENANNDVAMEQQHVAMSQQQLEVNAAAQNLF